MKTSRTILLVAVLALAMPLAAQAQQLFDFNGQVNVPTAIGGVLSMDSQVFDAAPATTPLPLDFGTYTYTITIDGLTLDAISGITHVYSGGTIVLWEDSTVILSGAIPSLSRTMFTSTLGTVNGVVDWTGGTRLGEIAPADQTGWAILSGINASASYVEPGYDENWDGKVEPEVPIVGNEDISWSELKNRF